MRDLQMQREVHLYRRWRSCLLWRGIFMGTLGPTILGMLWMVAAADNMVDPPRDLALAYRFLVAASFAFGLFFWSPSPLQLRNRVWAFVSHHRVD